MARSTAPFDDQGPDTAATRMTDSLQNLTAQVDQFAKDRDWRPFHSPKNLASALVVEAGELLEHFQWLTEDQSRTLSAEKRSAVGAEVVDRRDVTKPSNQEKRPESLMDSGLLEALRRCEAP